jgi:hypothetical protein
MESVRGKENGRGGARKRNLRVKQMCPCRATVVLSQPRPRRTRRVAEGLYGCVWWSMGGGGCCWTRFFGSPSRVIRYWWTRYRYMSCTPPFCAASCQIEYVQVSLYIYLGPTSRYDARDVLSPYATILVSQSRIYPLTPTLPTWPGTKLTEGITR